MLKFGLSEERCNKIIEKSPALKGSFARRMKFNNDLKKSPDIKNLLKNNSLEL